MRMPVAVGIRVTQEYGITSYYRSSGAYPTPGHLGMDLAAPSGSPLLAPSDGRIKTVNTSNLGTGWGAFVQLEDGRYTHTFGHLRSDKMRVSAGDDVSEGDVIAETGSTGWSTGPHLHWQVMDVLHGADEMEQTIDPRHALNPGQYERGHLEDYAALAALREGLDPHYFKRQINQESGWNIYAYSHAGAIGIAQIVPRWHPGMNPWKPFPSLDYAAALMGGYLREFKRMDWALAAYNAGVPTVRAYGGVPPFTETENYVRIILDGWEAPTMSNGSGNEEIELNKWLKGLMEGVAQDAIGIANRALAGTDPQTLEVHDVNHRLKAIRDDWPTMWEAEKARRAGEN